MTWWIISNLQFYMTLERIIENLYWFCNIWNNFAILKNWSRFRISTLDLAENLVTLRVISCHSILKSCWFHHNARMAPDKRQAVTDNNRHHYLLFTYSNQIFAIYFFKLLVQIIIRNREGGGSMFLIPPLWTTNFLKKKAAAGKNI